MTEPTERDLESPTFDAVWQAIKGWDIGKLEDGRRWYSHATGTDVMTILEALGLTTDTENSTRNEAPR